MTYEQATLSTHLDNAAAARREAMRRQDAARWLCLFCHAPQDACDCEEGPA